MLPESMKLREILTPNREVLSWLTQTNLHRYNQGTLVNVMSIHQQKRLSLLLTTNVTTVQLLMGPTNYVT